MRSYEEDTIPYFEPNSNFNFPIVSNVEKDAVRYGIFRTVFIPINYMMPKGTNSGDISSKGKK